MAAETVVIDIEAQYRDKTTSGVEKSADDMERLRRKMADTEEAGKKANRSLEKIASTAASIARKTISIPVKIVDYATRPLRSLLNFATSLKGILAGLVVGQAGQSAFVSPTQYASTLTTNTLAFENLLGSAEAAQQMIKDIQAFDERSPFDTMQIIQQTRMLMTYKLADQSNVLSMIETIGDAAEGVGEGEYGIERIVRALGQMRAKGKVSAEEMLQLSEVNIHGWDYLAEAFGVSSAQVQEMTSKNQIPVEEAIAAILAGMQRDYGGMANANANRTIPGVWGQISSVIMNGPYLRWGQGLEDGALKGLKTMANELEENRDLLDDLGDQLYDISYALSNDLADAAEDGIGTMMDVMESKAFQNADLGGKASMLWENVIVKPFSAWWESDGQKFAADVAGKIGEGIGSFYSGAITTLLGIDAEGAAADGANIGAKFAEGFLEGFNADAVWEAIQNAFGSAAKILPGGAEPTTGSWISAALLGYGGFKLAGAAAPIVKGIGGILGGAGAAGAAAGATGTAASAGAAAAGAAGATGAAGAAGAGGLLASIGIPGVLGAAGGAMGIISGLTDFFEAFNEANTTKEKDVYGWSFLSKFGMVGAGAAAGAGIGSIIPGVGTLIGGLVGAGVGGLGALLGGGKLGQTISDFMTGKDDQEKPYRESIQWALDQDGLDYALEKIDEIETVQQARLELEQKLEKLDKGSKEYDETAQKIEDAKGRQEELTSAVEPFRDLLERVLALVSDINQEYEALGSKRLDLNAMGLSGAARYVGYVDESAISGPSKAQDTLNSTAVGGDFDPLWNNPILGKKGFASGTSSAPPGWAWVGEEGPELMKMRGGERIYNARDSLRIAEGNARSAGRSTGSGTVQVNLGGLGGLSVNITGGGTGGDVVEQIRAQLPEIGNELCRIIATQLDRSYANMPTTAVEGI